MACSDHGTTTSHCVHTHTGGVEVVDQAGTLNASHACSCREATPVLNFMTNLV